MGSGRSGSTIIDRFVGAHPHAFSCGELCNLVRALQSPNEFCACGITAANCPFWKSVILRWKASVPDHALDEYERLRNRFERLRSALPSSPRPKNQQLARYEAYTLALLEAISSESGTAVIVDSSKSPARARRLAGLPGITLTTLHLIRDPRAVAGSYLRSYPRSPKQGLQRDIHGRSVVLTSMDWLVTNVIASHVRRTPSMQSLQFRYEDFVSNPRTALEQIGGLVGLDFRHAVERFESTLRTRAETHMIAGNRMRMLSNVKLRPDLPSMQELGLSKWMTVTLLVLPAVVAFRYPLLHPLREVRQHGLPR